MKFGLREEIYNKIKKITQKYNYKFIIFGSRARGDYKNNSDIDIAIYGNITMEDEMKIRNDFDKIDMEYMVDIVIVDKIEKEELLENINKEGVLIE